MEKKGKKKSQNASKKSDWQRLKRPKMPPESEFDIIPFRLQPEELEADMRHPYVKDLYKNYRRLRKKQEKIIVTKKKLIDKGGDRSQLNKDQIEQLDGEAAVFAEMWEIVDRNEAYQESLRNAGVTIKVDEPGAEPEKKEEIQEKKEMTVVTRDDAAIRQEEREATAKDIVELVADIFLSQSAVETVMQSETFPRTESDYYAFNNLLTYNYVRSPIQFQHFGGSAQAMHSKLSGILLKLYRRSDESVEMQGVAPDYTFNDLRNYISRLSQFAKESLAEEHSKVIAQRQVHYPPQGMYPVQQVETVDVDQKEQEEKVEDMTRGIVDDEQPGEAEEEEEEVPPDEPAEEEEQEQTKPMEQPKEAPTWADEEDEDEVEVNPAEEEPAVQPTLEEPRQEQHEHGYVEPEYEQYPRGGTVRAGRYYSKYPRGGRHYGGDKPRGGWRGGSDNPEEYHHRGGGHRGYHYHNRSRGGAGRGYRGPRGGGQRGDQFFVDSDEEMDQNQKEVDEEGYQFVQDPSEKKKVENPYGYRQYGYKPGYGRGNRGNRGGYRGDQNNRGGYRGDQSNRGGYYGQKRGGWNKRGGRGYGGEEYGDGEQFHGGQYRGRGYGGRGYEKQEPQE